MQASKDPIQVIEYSNIEASIFPVEEGYRAVIRSPDFFWHPGVFSDLQLLWEWLRLQVETRARGLPLGGDWLMLEGDFDSNEIYQDWFIYDAGKRWEGYDPLTNRCYCASRLQELKRKIDQVERKRAFK